MYCYHCGKEIANEALMCPHCGAPTKNYNAAKQEEITPVTSNGMKTKALSVAGLVLSIIAFVTGVVFTAITLKYYYSSFVFIGELTILPALVGLSIGIYVLVLKDRSNKVARDCAICSTVFTSIILLFLFIVWCVVFSGALR